MLHADLLVIGGGPGGLAAARVGGQAGARVVLVDDAPGLGGQIWRAERGRQATEVTRWRQEMRVHEHLTVFEATRVIGVRGDRELALETPDGVVHLRWGKLVLATGAAELFLPFEGWTLPGVTGAGGLQALIKGGLPVAGRRVLIAGSGPLLLAAAATARRHGAYIAALVEQAPLSRLFGFAAGLGSTPGKWRDAARLVAQIGFARMHFGTRVIAAAGDTRVRTVTLQRGSERRTLDCDLLAVGWGLVPRSELAHALGCALNEVNGIVVDANQRTDIPDVFAAGECTGVGGREKAEAEGKVAAYNALNLSGPRLAEARREARRWARFANRVALAYRLSREASAPPDPGCLLCRCEDIPVRDIAAHRSWRDAKLQTRCGMGACQGRVCGQAARVLFGWPVGGPSWPLVPLAISALIQAGEDA